MFVSFGLLGGKNKLFENFLSGSFINKKGKFINRKNQLLMKTLVAALVCHL